MYQFFRWNFSSKKLRSRRRQTLTINCDKGSVERYYLNRGKICAPNDYSGGGCKISLSVQKQVECIGQSMVEDQREDKGRQGGEEICYNVTK
jgi:hypothetical protein